MGPVYSFGDFTVGGLGALKPMVHLNLGYTLLDDGPDFLVSAFEPAFGLDIAVGLQRKNIDLRLGYRYFEMDRDGMLESASAASDSLSLSGTYVEIAYRFNFGK